MLKTRIRVMENIAVVVLAAMNVPRCVSNYGTAN